MRRKIERQLASSKFNFLARYRSSLRSDSRFTDLLYKLNLPQWFLPKLLRCDRYCNAHCAAPRRR